MRNNFLHKISRAAVSNQWQHCRDIEADMDLYSPAAPKIISTYQKIRDVLLPRSSRFKLERGTHLTISITLHGWVDGWVDGEKC